MSEDLRTRLAEAVCLSTGHGPTPIAEAHREQADAALAVFADWLRERSTATGMQYRAEAELRRLADEIEPKESA